MADRVTHAIPYSSDATRLLPPNRKSRERIDLWSFVVAVDEKTKEILCLPSRSRVVGEISTPEMVLLSAAVRLFPAGRDG